MRPEAVRREGRDERRVDLVRQRGERTVDVDREPVQREVGAAVGEGVDVVGDGSSVPGDPSVVDVEGGSLVEDRVERVRDALGWGGDRDRPGQRGVRGKRPAETSPNCRSTLKVMLEIAAEVAASGSRKTP